MINPWKALNVHRKSTDEEIQKAFHKLAQKYHPDMQKGSEEKFHIINEAYQMIKDKAKRRFVLEVRFYGLDRCGSCTGAGVKAKSRGITGKAYTACNGCGGAGILIREEEYDNVIELRGTTSPSGKGRNKKR